jgi:hypothetical protein
VRAKREEARVKLVRFFRGIAVSTDDAETTTAEIIDIGLVERKGWWKMEHYCPEPFGPLFGKNDLSVEDIRPNGLQGVAVVCACGEVDGASYYACPYSPMN